MQEPKIKEKTWKKELEAVLWKMWSGEKRAFDANSKKPLFVIDTPPPYPSGRPWHIGAASHYAQIDMIARTARMTGHEVLFPIGIDRNGLPVELYTEKKHGIRIQDTPREKFVQLCATALDDLEAEMIGIMKSMGMSGGFENYYRTDSGEYRSLTQSTFIELWNRGMIYEDTRPSNYCTKCGTTIADAEIVYSDIPTRLVHMKFRVKETGETIIIASTRPELLPSCQVVMFNPADARYAHLDGKHATTPVFNREVPIIAHSYVDASFGSGLVMMCSYGDYNDVRIFRELKLPEIISVNMHGEMTHNAGNYAGMKIQEARKKIIEDMASMGIVEKLESVSHRTPTCERSKTPIEIIPMNEFYLKQLEFKDAMANIAKNIKFHPEAHRQILLNWIDAVSVDWPVSRRRFYGTEIPIWYCKECKAPNLPKPGKYYKPWKEPPPFTECQRCKSTKGFTGEERTFDTWVDSSISPLFVSRYRRDEEFFRKTYPVTLRPQAKDIIRTWLYYTMLRCYQLTQKAPFAHAWIMGYGVDEKGEKMSKSKGNVMDPIPVLDKLGADVFRFWSAAEASLGSDFRCSEQRIGSAGKFLTKLWNVARYVSSFPVAENAALTETDKWITGECDRLVGECLAGYEDFNFFIPANKIRDFVWNVFAAYYIELSKTRAYGAGFTAQERDSACYTLHYCLRTALKLLAPIAPFASDYLHRELYGTGIHSEMFPTAAKMKGIGFETEELVGMMSAIWKAKKDKGLSLKAEVKELVIPEKFKAMEKDIIATHNVKSIRYDKEIDIVLSSTGM